MPQGFVTELKSLDATFDARYNTGNRHFIGQLLLPFLVFRYLIAIIFNTWLPRAAAQEDSTAVDSDYEYYVVGCVAEETKPLSRGRFDVMFGVYLTQGAQDHPPQHEETARQEHRRVVRQFKLLKIGHLVKLGYDLMDVPYPHWDAPTERALWQKNALSILESLPSEEKLPVSEYPLDDYPRQDPPNTSNGSEDGGVRVPRNPQTPVLIGAAARALPKPGEESYIVPWHY